MRSFHLLANILNSLNHQIEDTGLRFFYHTCRCIVYDNLCVLMSIICALGIFVFPSYLYFGPEARINKIIVIVIVIVVNTFNRLTHL